jgi:hypothetical protein
VYVVVVEGAASAVAVPVVVTPADHVYEVAPAAAKLAVIPLQIVGELTVVTGIGLTVTVAIAVPVQPLVVAVTVYEVVVVGAAVAVFTPDAVAPAVHVYAVPPVAASVAISPLQIVGELTVGTMLAPTVTVEIAVEVHPREVPVTV